MEIIKAITAEITRRRISQAKLIAWFNGRFFSDRLSPLSKNDGLLTAACFEVEPRQLLIFFSKDSVRHFKLVVPAQKKISLLIEFIPLVNDTNPIDFKITYNLADNSSITIYEQHINKIPLELHQRIIAAKNTHFCRYKQLAPQNSFSEILTTELHGDNSQLCLREFSQLAPRVHTQCELVIKHLAKNCQSDLLYKALLKEQSRANFRATVMVPREAANTIAQVNNHNLLLDPTAIAHTSPMLKVYADNVTCKHGATVGEFDPLALYYLRSRGFGETDARHLLADAFASEINSSFPTWLSKNRPLPKL